MHPFIRSHLEKAIYRLLNITADTNTHPLCKQAKNLVKKFIFEHCLLLGESTFGFHDSVIDKCIYKYLNTVYY